jgi:hypothetical protein
VQVQIVDLHDDSVDLVLHPATVLAVAADVIEDLVDALVDAIVLRDGQPPLGEEVVHLGLGGDRRLALDGPDGPRPDAVHQHPERPDAVLHEREPLGALALASA